MKKILVALAVAVLATSASALAPSHDLTTQGGTNGSCSYCHAPHLWTAPGALAGVAPLWNRADVTVTQEYTSTTVTDPTIAAGPNSRTCLTCHDGITNLGAVLNGAIAGDLAAPIPGPAFEVGLDLSNDHPVGVTYTVVAGQYQATTLPLYAGNVECATCHEPHAVSANGDFLRLSRAALCGNCHLK